MGFISNLADSSLFVQSTTDGIIILLLNVDDMLVRGSFAVMVVHFLDLLKSEFAIKDLGDVHYFLGVEIKATETRLLLTQKRYAETILEKANMLDCKHVSTPLPSRIVAPVASDSFHNATLYRVVVGSLQYLTFTHSDLNFAVNYVSQFMHAPTDFHFNLVKRILHYVKSTLNFDHTIASLSHMNLVAYSDSDWAGCPRTRRSTTGFVTFLGKHAIPWCSRKQQTVSRSGAKAEY